MGLTHLTLTPTPDFTWQGNRAGRLTWTGSTVSLHRWGGGRRGGRERGGGTYLSLECEISGEEGLFHFQVIHCIFVPGHYTQHFNTGLIQDSADCSTEL